MLAARHLSRGMCGRAAPAAVRAERLSSEIEAMIRVDHAGELGADRIYAGQLSVLGGTRHGPTIRHMWQQERQHRARFEQLVREHRVRPTVMTPVWEVAGWALGAVTAALGPSAAMACTVAVETVIVEHYNDQLRRLALLGADARLLDTIRQFRDEEQEHHDTGLEHGALQAPLYSALTQAIKLGCKAAIAISQKI